MVNLHMYGQKLLIILVKLLSEGSNCPAFFEVSFDS